MIRPGTEADPQILYNLTERHRHTRMADHPAAAGDCRTFDRGRRQRIGSTRRTMSVFEEFARSATRDRQPGSARLAVTKAGRATLSSELGPPVAGSTFTLVLPASADDLTAHPQAVTPSAAASAVGEAVTTGDVLVIEDDPSAVRLLREYLEAAGYSVRVAPTGGRLAAVAERCPAVA
jgi:hypothetical protein